MQLDELYPIIMKETINSVKISICEYLTYTEHLKFEYLEPQWLLARNILNLLVWQSDLEFARDTFKIHV
jgi:hypothetical protein